VGRTKKRGKKKKKKQTESAFPQSVGKTGGLHLICACNLFWPGKKKKKSPKKKKSELK